MSTEKTGSNEGFGALQWLEFQITLLDGTRYPRARVQTVKGKQATLSLGTETTWEVPVRALLEDTRDDEAPLSGFMNLFLWNGDRMAGTVVGAGEAVRLEFAGIEGFTVPLDRVRAVHFGRTAPTGTDLTYRAAFKKMLARGRDAVLVPGPIATRTPLGGTGWNCLPKGGNLIAPPQDSALLAECVSTRICSLKIARNDWLATCPVLPS